MTSHRTATFFVFAALLLPAAAEKKSGTIIVTQETKIAAAHEYNAVFKMSANDITVFARFKKNPDGKPLPLDLRADATTQDFALRSWGIRTTHLIFGALQHRGFASELRNPLFTADNPLSVPRMPELRNETILYTSAVSAKHTAVSFRVGNNAFRVQGAYSLDRKNRAWISGQYFAAEGRRRLTAEFFTGTHTENLPDGAKWKKLYPDFGVARTYFPAAAVSYADSVFNVKCTGAWDLRGDRRPEYLGKGYVSCALPYFRLYAGFYKSSAAMRTFSGTFPGKDGQLILNLQAGTKRYRGGITGIAATKTEDTMKGIRNVQWKTGITVQAIPPGSKAVIQAFFSGAGAEDTRTLTVSGTFLHRGIIGVQDVCSLSPKVQWKQENAAMPLYVYVYQGNISYTAAAGKFFSVAVSLDGGTKNLKTNPYTFVTPEASCTFRCTTSFAAVQITTGFSYENKFFKTAAANKDSTLTWYATGKFTGKW